MERRNNFAFNGSGQGFRGRGRRPRRGGFRGGSRRGQRIGRGSEIGRGMHSHRGKRVNANNHHHKISNGIHFSCEMLEEVINKEDNEIIQFLMKFSNIIEVFENTNFTWINNWTFKKIIKN